MYFCTRSRASIFRSLSFSLEIRYCFGGTCFFFFFFGLEEGAGGGGGLISPRCEQTSNKTLTDCATC